MNLMYENAHPYQIFLFASFVGIIMLGVYLFFGWRISVVYQLKRSTRALAGFVAVNVAMLVLAFLLRNSGVAVLDKIGIIIIGINYCVFILCFLFLLEYIVSFFVTIPMWLMSVLIFCYLLFGYIMGTTTRITDLNISSAKTQNNQKILFISDLHVDIFHHKNYVQKIVNRIKEIKPDLVLLGGDLLDIPKESYVSAFLPFDELNIPVYATLGNHDAMGNSRIALDIFKETKIIPLRNKSILFSGLQIVGIDDKSYWSGKNLDDVLKESKITSGEYTILISHQPIKLDKLSDYPIDLELAGHTHHGQAIPITWLVWFFNNYLYGKYQLGDRIAFVSQGIGTWGAPIRIGSQSEMVLINLEKK